MNDQKQLKERILFFLPYDFGELESGSRVRPYKMYRAFQELGYEVTLIAGAADKRLAMYKEIPFSEERYAFCYCEVSTYPLHPFVDYHILSGIWKRGIPIGIYYRDAYWKFADYFNYKGLKRLELIMRYHSDLFFLSRIASVLFFPSESLASLFNLRVPKIVLPPGGECKLVGSRPASPLKAVYVGGVSERYGTDIMLRALKSVNQKNIHVTLDLVCRKNELENLPQRTKELLQARWVNIHHVSGDNLPPIYARCNIALIPIIKDSYNDLALPVKLFEYLSFGLPVVATACREMQNFIESNGCGIICMDNAQSISEALIFLVEHSEILQRLSSRAIETINNGNLWTDRAKTVARNLQHSTPENK